VNDLERDLRELLDDDARRVSTPVTSPEGLHRSARRRQALFAGVVGLAGVAIVAGVVAGASLLLPLQNDGPKPVGQGPTTTGTMNGITIRYPESWNLIDPDTAGLNGSPTMGESPLPRIALALAPTDKPETFGCPGSAPEDEAASFLMTVQEMPLALAGPTSTPWPVDLQPMNVGGAESACYPDWEFLRAGWTASNRTFEARVGFSPDATDEERAALEDSFGSMTFERSKTGGPTSVTLGTGTAGGEQWTLTANGDAGGIDLTLESGSSGSGTSFFSPATGDLAPGSTVLGEGPDRQLVAFATIPTDVVRVEGTAADGSVVEAQMFDIPDEIDPGSNAFVIVAPPGPLDLRGYDAAGKVVATGSIGGVSISLQPPVDRTLEDGRHFGYVRSVDTDARTIEFDLAYFLSGKEANDAYHAAGGTGPVPNDHFVVNDNPMLRTLPLSPDLRLRLLDWNHCCETFFAGDLALFAQAIEAQDDVTDGDLIYRGQSSWWITIENGQVTQIEEQYSP